MCGLSGYCRVTTGKSSIPNGRRMAIAHAMAIESRGRDATGFAWTQRNDDEYVYYAKRKGAATVIAPKLDLPAEGIRNLVAHSRFLTLGPAENNDNNHPVVAKNITLVHNGRVSNHADLIALSGLPRVGQVDSYALAAMLAAAEDLGADHPCDLLELVQGVAAIAWLDANETDVLHLARLSTRPLTIGCTRRGDFVFSSTRQTMLKGERMSGVGIVDITDVAEGTYMRVRDGVFEEIRGFKVNHPPITQRIDTDKPKTGTAVDKSGKKGKGKRTKMQQQRIPGTGSPNQNQKPRPTVSSYDPDLLHYGDPAVMSHDEYLAQRRRRDARAAELARLRMPQVWEDDIDWDSIVPRRGHAGYDPSMLDAR